MHAEKSFILDQDSKNSQNFKIGHSQMSLPLILVPKSDSGKV